MVAAAFKGVLVFRTKRGTTITYPVTASDVAAELFVFPDGNNDVVLPSNQGNLYLTDVILSAAGTDTAQGEIYVNGKFTGEKVLNAANVGTVYHRQFMSAPMGIAPGARFRVKQTA